MGDRVDQQFPKNINVSLHFHDASQPPSAMIFSLALLSLLIVTSLAAPIFYLEGSGLFVFLSHRKRNQYHPYHRSGSFVRRSQYQHHRRLKAPGGKLQDRSGVYPRSPYAALSPPATATRVQLRRPHAAPSPSAAASCEIDGVHQLYPRNSVSWWQRAAAAYAATPDAQVLPLHLYHLDSV